MRQHLIPILSAALILSSAAAGADDKLAADRPFCPAHPILSFRPEPSRQDFEPGTIEVRADAARAVKDGISQFTGNVEVMRDETAMRGGLVSYDDELAIVNLEDDVELWGKSVYWTGQHGQFLNDEDRAVLDEGDYLLLDRMGHGHADAVVVDRLADKTRLTDVEYTTCAPEQPVWKIRAERITLDHETDRGQATHVLLTVHGIPVFYSPYLSFPLSDKRKSGFLVPTVGSSNKSGMDFVTPYYWNIAPNRDATVSPRVIGDRGFMLGGQYRYLYPDHAGQVDIEAMANDSLRDGTSRGSVAVKHASSLASGRGSLRVDYNHVSDNRYFEDFGRNIDATSARVLPQILQFTYAGRRFLLDSLIESYQTVDRTLPPAARPYKRLPRIGIYSQFPQLRPNLWLGINGDATYFDRDDSIVGARVEVTPYLSYPFYRPGYYVAPKLELRHTEYRLDGLLPGNDDSLRRTVPMLSIDSGAVFERSFRFRDTAFLQTLEPRLFYLLVPRVAQDDLPVFDSGQYELAFANLFLDNRFSGRDRIADANQIAAAITTRLISRESGIERLRFSIGQVYYLRDREVTLYGQPDETTGTSELMAEIATRVYDDWSARAAVLWDPYRGTAEKAAVAVRWQPAPNKLLNLTYRRRENALSVYELDQTDLSFQWPLTAQLSLIGRWNFSLPENKSLETVAGIEYDSCCWSAKFVGRRFLRNTEGDFDTAFFIQFELKGLAGIGRSTASFLKQSIPGYTSGF